MGKPGMGSSDPHFITRYVLYTAQYVRNRSPYPAIFSKNRKYKDFRPKGGRPPFGLKSLYFLFLLKMAGYGLRFLTYCAV